MSSFRCLELLYTLVQGKLASQEDCLVVALHSFLINKGNKCAGLGEEFASNEDADTLSELLPDSWNSDKNVYSLRYKSCVTGAKYLLKVLKMGATMLVNVLNITDDKAAAMTLKTGDYISKDFCKFSGTFLNLPQLDEKLQQEIIQQVKSGSGSKNKKAELEDTKKEDVVNQSSDPCRPSSNPLEGYVRPSFENHPQRIPFPQVGRRDLDPFASGPGGMIFDPRNFERPGLIQDPFGLPRGSVPPGARFDPLGPNIFTRGEPDPDHLPPPGYDNSFI